MSGESSAQVQYIQDNQDIPLVLDEALGEILKNKAGASKDEVLKCLAQYALSNLSPNDGARVASRAVPNFARAGVNAETLAGFSSIAHNMSQKIFVEEEEGKEGGKKSDEDPDENPAPLQRQGTITAYNKTSNPGSPMSPGAAADFNVISHWVKTIATIGPASAEVQILREMMRSGMTVARLNLNHGTQETHTAAVQNIREAATEEKRHISIAIDTRGAQVRLGKVPNDSLKLESGKTINLSTNEKYKEAPTEEFVYVTWPHIAANVNIGQRVCVADGLLTLSVVALAKDNEGKDFLECQVENDFELGSDKGVNLPGVTVDIPILNEVTKADFDFAIKNGIDIIFLSFVQKAEDVKEVREYLKANGMSFPSIISEIGNQTGLRNVDSILHHSEGIMVARGDLGSELPIQKLFVAQKSVIAKCNVAGKPVIVSAQLLESMVKNAQPTRAEANDVANAVLDGTDSLMLSGESAVGAYPVGVIQTMKNISIEALRFLPRAAQFRSMVALQPRPMPDEEAIASSAVNSAMELKLKAIVTLTTSGSSARSISKYCPPCPILAVCKTNQAYNMLNLVKGVIPFRYDGVEEASREERLQRALQYLKEEVKLLHSGDLVALVHADIHGPPTGFANVCRVAVVE